MTVYNKLKIAILAIISSQSIYAITIDPIQVQSGSGDLLYAEMKFRHSDPNARIEVGLAEADDLITMGVAHQPPGHLNFFTRRSGDGSGVIVITSSRPVTDSELNILLKIKEGSATHIQQVKTPLKRNRVTVDPITAGSEKPLVPQVIVSEKDIELNLPTSTRFNALSDVSSPSTPKTTAQFETPIAISIAPSAIGSITTHTTAPPPLNQQTSSNDIHTQKVEQKTETPNATAFDPQHTTTVMKQEQQLETKVAVQKNVATQPEQKKTAPITEQKQTQTADQKENSKKSEQHVVQANESLWKIASRIAAQTNQSIPDVMRQIKANNEHAFIQGDINRIRRGVALNLAAGTQTATKAPSKQTVVVPPTTQKQSGKAKYRLNQAEMSLVADNSLDAAHGKSKKDHQQNQTNAELSTKVMTSREKTVKLQKNVSELALALQQKDQRIQLLNARLAQLQQQLQQQNRTKKSAQ